MGYALPPLLWLRTFEAAARHLSFARAADELALTPAAVSQQIRALEAHVGFALFERLPRGVRLTSVGTTYLAPVRRALDDLAVATTGLFGATGRAVLTVRSAVSFAALCLAPQLGEFRAAHPRIAIRLYASIWSDEMDDGRLDLDVRYGDGRWDGYAIEPLSAAVSVPVLPPGSGPDLLSAVRGRPIHIIGCDNLWTQLAREQGWPEDAVAGGIAVDTSLVALEMVAAGMGCALVSRELARHHVGLGRVQLASEVELRHDQRHYLLMPRRSRAPSSEALLLRDWLLDRFGEDRRP